MIVPEISLKSIREELLANTRVSGLDWCRSYASKVDRWIEEVFLRAYMGGSENTEGIALLAVGGYGRKELYPHSDLDILLVCNDDTDIAEVADAIWYPIWDQGIKLDHAVRTPGSVIVTAREDSRVLLGLLDARHLVGDRRISKRTIDMVNKLWMDEATMLLPGILDEATSRHSKFGDLAFLLEPDLKESRGGLRDVAMLRCLVRSDSYLEGALNMHRIKSAHEFLAEVRVELHRNSARPGECLHVQEQDQIARVLHIESADDLMARVADAGRAITANYDALVHRMSIPKMSLRNRIGQSLFSLLPWKHTISLSDIGKTEQLEPGILVRHIESKVGFQYREIVLEHTDDKHAMPNQASSSSDYLSLPFRASAASSEHHIPLSPAAIKTISNVRPLPDQAWPREVLESFLRVVRSGDEAITTLEILEQENILSHYIPEWEIVRNLRQHNAYHRYTVDRHLLETAVRSGELCSEEYSWQEATILIVSALLHDIGKGLPGDHSTNGARLARKIAIRMGLVEPSVSMIGILVRHHLLLPDLATRRDIHDPATSEKVITAFPDITILELAEILAKADGEATGPLAWGPWKEGLVHDLVRIARMRLEGLSESDGNERVGNGSGSGSINTVGSIGHGGQIDLMGSEVAAEDAARDMTGPASCTGEAEIGGRHVSVVFFEEPTGGQIIVKTYDLRGLLASIAGVFALRGINIRSADVSTIGDMAIDSFAVEMRIGDWPDWVGVAGDIARVLNGELDLDRSIREREHLYREHPYGNNEEYSYRELAGKAYSDKDANSRDVSYRDVSYRDVNSRGASSDGGVKVVLDSGASAAFSVLEVHSDDSLGLLYRLTKILFDNELDVIRARVSTIGNRIVDSFYISNDQIGRAITEDGSLLPDIERALLRAALPL